MSNTIAIATVESLTSSQKGKFTKAMKTFTGFAADELVAIGEMVCLYILEGQKVDFDNIEAEMVKRARVEALAIEASTKPTKVVTLTPRVAMTLGEAMQKAQDLLGPDAKVLTATHDYKGKQFTAPYVIVGVPTEKPEGRSVFQGVLMIGAGLSFAAAINATKKRLASAPSDTHEEEIADAANNHRQDAEVAQVAA